MSKELKKFVQVVDAEYNLIHLRPGLARLLKELVDQPELKLKYAYQDDDENWVFDDRREIYIWYPGSDTQTCFMETVRYPEDGDESEKVKRRYYQLEYYEVPGAVKSYNDSIRENGEQWVVVQVNNCQLREWLEENDVLDESDEIIKEINKNGTTLRYEHNSSMERETERAND